MYSKIKGYQTAWNFAKKYKNAKTGKVGVTRSAIYQLLNKEMQYPESTGLDVLEIDGNFFVRYKEKDDKNEQPEK